MAVSADVSIEGELLNHAEEFLRRYYKEEIGKLAERYPSEQKALEIDWGKLFKFDPDLADDYADNPTIVRGHLKAALSQVNVPIPTNDDGEQFEDAEIRIGGFNDAEIRQVGEYEPAEIGNAIAVKGQVAQSTQVQPALIEGVFECGRCGTPSPIPQAPSKNDIQEPYSCDGCDRDGPYELQPDASTWRQSQIIRIQPPPEAAGKSERYVDARLTKDLAGKVQGGERIIVTGILRVSSDQSQGDGYEYYLEGNHLEIIEGGYDDIEIEPYHDEIAEIRDSDDPIGKLKNSFAPQIHRTDDLDTIVEALILQMFGTYRHDSPDGPTKRGDSHILLLGDPGTAKSDLLLEVERLSPISKFKSGKNVSAVGLTAGAESSDFGPKKFSLKAGMMVTASGGVACLDEIDKVRDDDLDALHTPLENQRVSYTKAGIDADLPARTALLAAGNPKDGRFEEYDAIPPQIDLPPSLLSRFDLMFMLADKPDIERDAKIGEHIAASWRESGKLALGEDPETSIADREISEDVFEAYIADARQRINPTIEDRGVEEKAIDAWSELRRSGDDDTVPVTARKLEAMIRLAKASARARMSETVEFEDMERASKLVLKSMKDVGIDPETGQFDVDVIETGKSKSQRERIKTIRGLIEEIEGEYENGAPFGEIKNRANDVGLSEDQVEDEIETMRDEGNIYEPADGYLRTT